MKYVAILALSLLSSLAHSVGMYGGLGKSFDNSHIAVFELGARVSDRYNIGLEVTGVGSTDEGDNKDTLPIISFTGITKNLVCYRDYCLRMGAGLAWTHQQEFGDIGARGEIILGKTTKDHHFELSIRKYVPLNSQGGLPVISLRYILD